MALFVSLLCKNEALHSKSIAYYRKKTDVEHRAFNAGQVSAILIQWAYPLITVVR